MTAADALASVTLRARVQAETGASLTTIAAVLRGESCLRPSRARERIREALKRAGVDLATIPQVAAARSRREPVPAPVQPGTCPTCGQVIPMSETAPASPPDYHPA